MSGIFSAAASTHIKYRKPVLIVALILLALNCNAQVDSSYIGFFKQKISIRPYLIEQFTALSSQTNDDDEISYKPNSPYGIGLGVTYKNISLSGSYGFDFMRDKKKGTTKSLDLQYHRYGRKVVVDIFFQNYKGLYTDTDEKNGIYTYFPDVHLIQYGAFAQYIFNGNRFSYRAAFDQDELQLKSTGSFLLGGGVYYNKAKSDSSLVFIDERQLNNFQFGVSAGYAYTWVINKRVFISGSLSVGVNVGAESIDRFGKERLEVYPTIFPRFSAGYNHDSWSVGLSILNNRVYVLYSGVSKLSFDTGAFQLSFIKRFDKLPFNL